MGSLMKKQAERFLREKKRHRRWLAMFLCLALLVTSGTFAALRMNGQAMDHGGKALNCRLRVHTHGEECFDKQGELTCGKADVVIHTHNRNCYDEEGILACQLPEKEAHVHDSNCYIEEENLICQEPETSGHQHSEQCYIEETGDLLCAEPEHEHGEGCYDEEGNLLCGLEAHTHGEGCFATNQVLICSEQEGGGHTHSSSCYEKKKTLVCEKEELELHTHDELACYDENGALTCKKLELEEHEHGNGCFDEEKSDEEKNSDSGEPEGIVSDNTSEETGKDEESKEEPAEETPAETEKPKENASDDQTPEDDTSDDEKSEEPVSDNSVSGNVSENAVSENQVSGNTVSGGDVSGNSVSGNVSGNSTSENSVSGNGVSGNAVSENNIITLETEADGTTITLSGPTESFDPDKEYELDAKVIEEDSKEGKQIKKAIDKALEKEEGEAEKYRAFDIKLMSDGEEVQPLGAVSVNFISKDIKKSVADEKTEVSVFHVDDKAKKAEDMEAETTEEGTVTMETTHFSIYVVIDKGSMGGAIQVELEHWGENIKTISANGTTDPFHLKLDWDSEDNNQPTTDVEKRYGLYTKDEVYDRHTQTIVSQNYTGELYRPDFIKLENELQNYSIQDLSKVFLGMDGVKEKVDARKYQIEKIWISSDLDNKGEDAWEEDTYEEYYVRTTNSVSENGETVWDLIAQDVSGNDLENPTRITLRKDSVIRFWYKETDATDYIQQTTFYDYNLSNSGQASGTYEGINTRTNFKPETETFIMGSGQYSSGNHSDFTGGTNGLNEVMSPKFGFFNQGNRWDNIAGMCTADQNAKEWIDNQIAAAKNKNDVFGQRTAYWAMPVKGLVQDRLTEDYQLQFSSGFKQPGFFEEGTGKVKLTNYSLGFRRTGDTYILSSVKKGEGKDAVNVLSGLENIVKTARNGRNKSRTFSNNFFPLDSETGGDAKGTGSDDGKAHNWHFGMQYSFYFNIGDYTGPMNYYFRGDDDFWLFVDGQKVIDLGGIHSSVGQAVDLRQWMEDAGLLEQLHQDHRIDVFYMERGGFGSCCYMQFTLPNCIPASSVETENHVNVKAKKQWVDEQEGTTHESVYVDLIRKASNGIHTRRETKELNAENNWQYEWIDLPTVDINNTDIKYEYYVEESSVPEGYVCDIEKSWSDDTKTFTYTITNTQHTKDISVEKRWEDYNDKHNIRPEAIQVQLKADGEPLGAPVTLNEGNEWKCNWENLPMYKQASSQDIPELIKYTVEEIGDLGEYISTCEKVEGTGDNLQFIITNALAPEWKIIKRNANNHEKTLQGAQFSLTPAGDGASTNYIGESGEKGLITWHQEGSDEPVEKIQPGTYMLSETMAPEGYALSEETWTIKISPKGVLLLIKNNKTGNEPLGSTEIIDNSKVIMTFYFDNTMLYELPETGGIGTYWYTIGGMLLMMGAALILYRSKYKRGVRGC